MPSHDIEHCTGEGCGVRLTCYRAKMFQEVPEALRASIAVRAPQEPSPTGCDLYWQALRHVCPQPGHGRKYMHGDTLLCMECGGLVPAAPSPDTGAP